ncbi:hypothetical protein M2299_000307 [Stenotrophomonas sp. 1278]|uniref:hypothetical protein n=1 Tax=Stenotrophomonas sp. 1278 TaxID=2940566 RepID=UPI0024762596|nr:hypothetical protein [Stenotrophomonas sp. 1278]MDH6329507.1 hypothetical protein [Stenotrophomonas sp. 1278]
MDALSTFMLLAIAAAISLASGLFLVRVATLRDYTAKQPERESHFATSAIAELRRLEIEATKRGNLLAAAELADAQERAA